MRTNRQVALVTVFGIAVAAWAFGCSSSRDASFFSSGTTGGAGSKESGTSSGAGAAPGSNAPIPKSGGGSGGLVIGSGSGVIAIPRVASNTMTRTSKTDDTITQRLGRELHRRRRSRTA